MTENKHKIKIIDRKENLLKIIFTLTFSFLKNSQYFSQNSQKMRK